MKTIKDDIISDAINTAFELSEENVKLKRLVVILFVIIACLLIGYMF